MQITEHEAIILEKLRNLELHEKITIWKDHKKENHTIVKIEKNIILVNKKTLDNN